MMRVSKLDPWVSYWNQKIISGSQIDETESLQLGGFWAAVTPTKNDLVAVLELGPGDKPIISEMNLPPGEQCLRVAVDISQAALSRSSADISPVCANGRLSLPFQSNRFDLIVSQFGAEYCGEGCLKNLPRHLRAGGTIALICHHRGSAIYQVYMNSKRALEQIKRLDLYESLREALSGYSNGMDVKLNQIDQILDAFGADACGGFISLIRELAVSIVKNEIEACSPSAQDIEEFERATESYSQLIETMLDSALSKSQLDDIINAWESKGFSAQVKQIRNGGLSMGTQIIATHAD